MDLDYGDGIRLIIKATEERENELLFQRWLLHYEKEIPYSDFKKKMMKSIIESDKRKIDATLTEEKILEDVEGILNTFRG